MFQRVALSSLLAIPFSPHYQFFKSNNKTSICIHMDFVSFSMEYREQSVFFSSMYTVQIKILITFQQQRQSNNGKSQWWTNQVCMCICIFIYICISRSLCKFQCLTIYPYASIALRIAYYWRLIDSDFSQTYAALLLLLWHCTSTLPYHCCRIMIAFLVIVSVHTLTSIRIDG